MEGTEEHILTQDNDGHWYIIPSDREKDFNEWLSIDPDDERSWTPPEYSLEVGGSPTLVKFKAFRIE
jgi:hypothetical protein